MVENFFFTRRFPSRKNCVRVFRFSVRWVPWSRPNRYHHLHVKTYIEKYPKALVYAAPGLLEKRKDLRFHHVLTEESPEAWEGNLVQTLVGGMPALNEVALFHPASRTLLLTDLCFNYPPSESS